MKVSYRKEGIREVICYTKGSSREDIICFLEARVAKRKIDIERRAWIVEQYNRLVRANARDEEWIRWLNTLTEEQWAKSALD